MSSAIFPLTYLSPVSHFAVMLEYSVIQLDIHEFFHKQHLFSRCLIYGPNGVQKLIIPIHKKFEKTPLKDIEIGYEIPWQKIHWRSFEAAYRRSPYFEFYEDDLYPLYMEFHPKLLMDWNRKLFETVCTLAKIDINPVYSDMYSEKPEGLADFRFLGSPDGSVNRNLKIYHQVFEERYGFMPNLSILDLLFCEGPKTKDYLIS